MSVPETPVIVTVLVPVVAWLLAANVNVLVPVAGFGLNLAVTPLPSPLADNVTLPLNPFDGVIVIVAVPWEDRVIVRVVGDADSEKSPTAGALTVNMTVVVSARPPPVPVTVIGYVPVAVVAATVKVIVELPDPGAVIEIGLKVTVTPVGCPLALNEIAESNPPDMLVVIVELPAFPCTTVSEAGEADTLNEGLVLVGASALMSPVPFGLPQPVTRS